MSGFKRIPKEIKEQVLARVKEGVSVSDLSSQHAVSTKTIYGWIAKQSGTAPSVLAIGKLRHERDDLLKIVGQLTLRITRREKNHDY